ncbi:bifunctional (p)ppGpp synthetase/guanosine-3',5'-bis(diphosphate) 3'-pyrophosphohydrolase [Candidatus Kinetoplastidibacterium galati]|uniref:GTP pyrophosphokinase n=1 Tax=Candidatus Kinetoplastidibacterium galati TCC219 TaxID=1208921 RepID=M1LYN0_9PROT|nr:bifunctional (p)ppGpp synthetase/guanosine-3',5'-bis(diphosphate) 3'-pyrophosphohydrolase [Candidatus Kinetoplastibacterium galatii]AGF49176.1 GTP pyrophosphokinase [Candidatus Kinetoplastibacterium galatii TCC219]
MLLLPISKIISIDNDLLVKACSCFYVKNNEFNKMFDIIFPTFLNFSNLKKTITAKSVINDSRNLNIPILSSNIVYDSLVTRIRNNLSLLNFFDVSNNKIISTYESRSIKYIFNKNLMIKNMLSAMTLDLRTILSRILSRLQLLSYSISKPGYKLIYDMEDTAFKMLYPDQYGKIALLFDDQKADREIFIESTLSKIKSILNRYGIKAEISGRLKHIYSIWNKMCFKNIDFSRLYDLSALRVVVDDVKTCYMVLDIVHKLWDHIPEEFDDYISRPKPNGYQSLHTVVIDKDNYLIEIQIRTCDMHNFAEYGLASHWFYKKFRNVGIDNFIE